MCLLIFFLICQQRIFRLQAVYGNLKYQKSFIMLPFEKSKMASLTDSLLKFVQYFLSINSNGSWMGQCVYLLGISNADMWYPI